MERFSLISHSELYKDPEGNLCWYSDYKLLLEANKRLVRAYDRVVGTPCEQIRHAQEVERLKEELAEARKQQAHNAACVLHLHRKLDEARGHLPHGHVGTCPNSEHCNNTGVDETLVSPPYHK